MPLAVVLMMDDYSRMGSLPIWFQEIGGEPIAVRSRHGDMRLNVPFAFGLVVDRECNALPQHPIPQEHLQVDSQSVRIAIRWIVAAWCHCSEDSRF
jgi:hypothetical protein